MKFSKINRTVSLYLIERISIQIAKLTLFLWDIYFILFSNFLVIQVKFIELFVADKIIQHKRSDRDSSRTTKNLFYCEN